jgi:hypothetical protein
MIVKGLVKRVGAGTWRSQGAVTGTAHSLLEIGEDSIRNVFVPEYISNFLEPGANVEALIVRILGRKHMLAIKCDGKVHRDYHVRLILFAVVFALPAFFLMLALALPVPFPMLFGLVGAGLILGLISFFFAWSAFSVLTFNPQQRSPEANLGSVHKALLRTTGFLILCLGALCYWVYTATPKMVAGPVSVAPHKAAAHKQAKLPEHASESESKQQRFKIRRE